MKNYNYADEIIKDYDKINYEKIDEPDIIQNILKFSNNINSENTQDKIKGFMEGLKSDNIIANLK